LPGCLPGKIADRRGVVFAAVPIRLIMTRIHSAFIVDTPDYTQILGAAIAWKLK